jgi:hypothetical protein
MCVHVCCEISFPDQFPSPAVAPIQSRRVFTFVAGLLRRKGMEKDLCELSIHHIDHINIYSVCRAVSLSLSSRTDVIKIVINDPLRLGLCSKKGDSERTQRPITRIT